MSTIATIFLEESTDTSSSAFVIANNNTAIAGGATGSDYISINSNVTGTVVASTIEDITLAGNIGDYKFKQGFGSNIEIYKADGTTLVMKLTDVDGKNLTFNDNALTALVYDSTNDNISVGGIDIGNTIVALTIPTTATTAAADLITEDAASTAMLEATATTITGSVADIGTVLTSAGLRVASDVALTISDATDTAVNAADLAAIGGATTGTVIATNKLAISGTAAEVKAALVTTATKIVNEGSDVVTISDAADATAVAAADLVAIDSATSGTVTITNAVALTGTASDLNTVLVTNASTTVDAGTEAVTISDANATSIAATALSAIADKTTGTVTATNAIAIGGTTAEVKQALVTDGVIASTATVGIVEANSYTITAADLAAIGAKTSGEVAVNTGTADTGTITGTTAELVAALVTTETKVVVDDAAATVGDATDTAVNAADLAAIGGATTGTVTATNKLAISGTAAEVKAALVTTATKIVNEGSDVVTISDAADATAVAAADLVAIDSATSGTVTITNAVALTGTASDLNTVLVTNASTTVDAGTEAVTISDATDSNLSAATVKAIDDESGTVTITNSVVLSGTATGSATADTIDLTGMVFTSGDVKINGDDGADVITAGSATDVIMIYLDSDNGGTEKTFSAIDAYDTVASFAIASDRVYMHDIDTSGSAADLATAANATASDTTSGNFDITIDTGIITAITKGDGNNANALTVGTDEDVDTLAEVVAILQGDSDISANQAVAFEFGGNTYIYGNDQTAGVSTGDSLVELTGITGATSLSDASGVFTVA